ncbi:MAG: hypothetical protein AAF696_06295 [Bacteroidota bacterium]
MQYINPLALLEISVEEAKEGISSSRLKREKKKLMAEFELNNASNIELRGIKLGKNQVLEMFDQLADEKYLDFHSRILSQASLLQFLEESSLDYFYFGDISMLSANSPEFLSFLAPYFSHQYNKRLLYAFKQRDWEEIQTMSSHPLPIPSKFFAQTYKDTFHHIHTHIKEVEETTQKIEKGISPDGKVQEYCDELFIAAINRLPEYFSGSRDRYALALENLAIAVHNVHKRPKLAVFILKQGLKLHLGEDARSALLHILKQLEEQDGWSGIMEILGGKEKDSGVPWLIAAGTGLAALLLYRWLK